MLYPILYLEINLASVMLVLFIRFKTLGISKMVSQRTFSSAIDAEVVFFLSDTMAVLISCGLIPAGKAGLLAAKSIYFFSTALMCFFWFIYFEHLQGSQFVANRRLVLLSSCLVWIMGILLIINLFNGILFMSTMAASITVAHCLSFSIFSPTPTCSPLAGMHWSAASKRSVCRSGACSSPWRCSPSRQPSPAFCNSSILNCLSPASRWLAQP